MTDLVEALHHNIARAAPVLGHAGTGRTRGVTGLVYRVVRRVTRLVGGGIDAALARLVPVLAEPRPTAERESVLAALNGVLGDHLAETGNPLAITMRLRQGGNALVLERDALARAVADPKPRVAVLVHGLCMNDLQWSREGHDHGALLAREAGCTSLYLHYNTGLHLSANGRSLSALLETVVREWPVPVEELVLVGHSMGGLVIRSALHFGADPASRWLGRVRAVFFLGTPHFGAPLARGGNRLDLLLGASPYSAPFARLGKIRSAGITDLHHGALRDEDWAGRDRFAPRRPPRRSLPLPAGVACHAIAGSTGRSATGLAAHLLGDGLVPVAGALGRHATKDRDLGIPASRQWVAAGTGHLELLSSAKAGERMLKWLALAPKGDRGPSASSSG